MKIKNLPLLASQFRLAITGTIMLAALNGDKRADKEVAPPIVPAAPITEVSYVGPNDPYDLVLEGRGGYQNPWDNIVSRAFDMQDHIMRSSTAEDRKLQQGFKKWADQFNVKASAPLIEKLAFVTTTINKAVVVKSDMEQFGVVDYAAPVARTVSAPTLYGDCEDYALMKYYALRHIGVEKERMSILFVGTTRINGKEPDRLDHAVLAVDTSRTMNGRNAIILDNLNDYPIRTKYTSAKIFDVINENKGRQKVRFVKVAPIAPTKSPSCKIK